MPFLEITGWLTFAALLALLVIQAKNVRLFVRPDREIEGSLPFVSVLVPARNEEATIRSCVLSLLAQDYPGELEVVVLDDHSTDRTAGILKSLSIVSERLRVIPGEPLPEGWTGKNWACAQLAKASRGRYLVFTDADTTHQQQSIGAAVQHAGENDLDLLSLMPRQRMESFWERSLLPLMYFFYLTFFPRFMLEHSNDPRIAAGNGQFMLFSRGAYQAIGGHESVRGNVVDDLALARRIREGRLTLEIADGWDLVECRMYGSVREIIAGFTKNLFAAVGGTGPRAVLIGLGLVALFTAPPLVAVATGHFAWIVAALMGIWLRFRTTARTGEPFGYALLHPLAVAVAVSVLFRSMSFALRNKGPMWKGREVGRPH